MQLTHAPEFRIHLEDDHIILHGTPEESAGVVLRGSVILNCHEPTKVKSVYLEFLGMTNVNWCEGMGSNLKQYRAERKLIEKEWTFLELQKKAHVLPQGQYKWDFELPLPGDLPESVKHEMGQVEYKLKAYCDRPTFCMDYVDKKVIKISRLLLPSCIEYSESVEISSTWANKLVYDIGIPTQIYCADKTIPITFDLQPIAPNLTVRSVACSLKEYTTCTTPEHHKTESKILNYLRDDRFEADANGNYFKTELLHVPAESNLIHYDMSGDMIEVKHKVKFVVSLQNSDGHISELRAAIPVVIAPLAPEDDQNALPAYEDAWKTIPYDSETLADMIAMGEVRPPMTPQLTSDSVSSIMSDASSTLSSLAEEEEEEENEPICWNGMDITRCPSYSTALLSNNVPCNYSQSLPSYDSIVIV